MRILICEDSVLLREGLVRLLEDAGDEVVAALADTDGLLDAVVETEPELCILDVRLPPTFTDEGIRAALEIRAAYPSLPLLVLSQYVEERYASELIASQSGQARGGALGYLLKDRVTDVAEFIDSVRSIAAGSTVLDPEVVAQLLTRRNHDERMQRLTERERTVLALIAEGRSNSAIATTLFLSEASVEKHITAIFQKLGLEREDGNRRVLAALAHIENIGTAVTDAGNDDQGGRR
ncbi:response regulator transcription factor [Microbacterium soli]|uniref:Response regulator transcription factor n=1 Tax=Microbacterium soli TaxID=446075 RepID=A0ABP7N432_9MICO